MRLSLDLEQLHVESTVLTPELAGIAGHEGFEPGGYAASILWDTQTRPIIRNTNSSPCVA
jgi:hypothetical protein